MRRALKSRAGSRSFIYFAPVSQIHHGRWVTEHRSGLWIFTISHHALAARIAPSAALRGRLI